MKRRIITGCLTGGIIILLLILLWPSKKITAVPPSPEQQTIVQANKPNPVNPILQQNPSPTTAVDLIQKVQAHEQQVKLDADAEVALWQSPIIYFGKVVDESNLPISGVKISYSASAMDESRQVINNTGTVISDERGIFRIDGVNGINLMVQLSHPGYYPYPENSTGFDKRAVPRIGYFSDSEDKAELFRMHSKGHPVPLVHRVGGVNVPLGGTPTSMALRGGDYKEIIGDLVIQASGNPPQRYNQQPFDWEAKITVPNGGLVEFTNQFDFVAPDSGYQPSIEFTFQKEMVGWTDTVSKNYFVKLPSGYARLNIYIGAKNPLFFSISYDYNPDGSANLERAH